MSLPAKNDLLTLDYAWRGSPFVHVQGNQSFSTLTLDYAWKAQPFVTPFAVRRRRVILCE